MAALMTAPRLGTHLAVARLVTPIRTVSQEAPIPMPILPHRLISTPVIWAISPAIRMYPDGIHRATLTQ